MDYLELFTKAGLVEIKEVEIAGLGKVCIRKPDAALAIARERLFLEHAVDGKIEPTRLMLLDIKNCVVDDAGRPFLTDDVVITLPETVISELWQNINAMREGAPSLDELDDEAKKS